MGWSEIFVIGIVALIVVGPKDLPGMFRELGKFTSKMRGMAREFQRAMEDAADQSGVGDVAKTIRGATNPQAMGLDAIRDATNWDDDTPKAGAPKPLPKDRAEVAEKIQAATAEKEAARRAEEAAQAQADTAAAPEPDAPKSEPKT